MKGLLFLIPMALGAIIVFALAGSTIYASVWAVGPIIATGFVVFLYIHKNQKHEDPGNS